MLTEMFLIMAICLVAPHLDVKFANKTSAICLVAAVTLIILDR